MARTRRQPPVSVPSHQLGGSSALRDTSRSQACDRRVGCAGRSMPAVLRDADADQHSAIDRCHDVMPAAWLT